MIEDRGGGLCHTSRALPVFCVACYRDTLSAGCDTVRSAKSLFLGPDLCIFEFDTTIGPRSVSAWQVQDDTDRWDGSLVNK
jgi:hypothetical protein